MECPVCKTTGLAENLTTCPHCNSDLEAYQLTEKIEKTSRNRMLLGIIASILFMIVLFIWLFGYLLSESNTKEQLNAANEEINQLKIEQQKVKSENEQLKSENKNLQDQVKGSKAEMAQRQESYIVQPGETLFLIARKVYGNGFKYHDLAKANNIADPDNILEGQKLTIYY